ncbi:MAG: aspartate-semialdehyde dehydrogenase [Candidatus Omnitrophica bacterium]|nr:aspartate-semialdehyde dehydrogenase [Candidatus Omnitrophota bacterium]
MQKNKYNVAVVGVGAVGEEMLRVLAQRKFPVGNLRVFARSAREINVDNKKYSVEAISNDAFAGINIALFAGTEGEKGAAVTYGSEAVKRGAVVIDNGRDFRMDPNVPLIVPEVNAQEIKKHKGIIANPNCTTIQFVVAINPIYKKAGIDRLILCSYQAASGAGRSAVEQLQNEYRVWANGSQEEVPKGLPQKIAFNVFPQVGSFAQDDYTEEEWKTVHEAHKILGDDKIKISSTTVRVSVKTGHSQAIYLETKKHISPEAVKDILSKAPGVKLVDDPKNNLYPMPLDVEGRDEVFVGRVRRDPFVKNGLWLWVVADNLRKGAATNAVQIAEELIK